MPQPRMLVLAVDVTQLPKGRALVNQNLIKGLNLLSLHAEAGDALLDVLFAASHPISIGIEGSLFVVRMDPNPQVDSPNYVKRVRLERALNAVWTNPHTAIK